MLRLNVEKAAGIGSGQSSNRPRSARRASSPLGGLLAGSMSSKSSRAGTSAKSTRAQRKSHEPMRAKDVLQSPRGAANRAASPFGAARCASPMADSETEAVQLLKSELSKIKTQLAGAVARAERAEAALQRVKEQAQLAGLELKTEGAAAASPTAIKAVIRADVAADPQESEADAEANAKVVAAAAAAAASAAAKDEQYADESQAAWNECEGNALDAALGNGVASPADAPIRLIDARFLRQLAAGHGRLVERRELPEGAFFSLERLRREGHGNGPDTATCLRVLAVIFPDGYFLLPMPVQAALVQRLGRVLEAFIEEDGGSYGVCLPSCSLARPSLQGLQRGLFEAGLAGLASLYSHEAILVLELPALPAAMDPAGHATRAFNEGGWSFYQGAVAKLVKPPALLLDVARFHDGESSAAGESGAGGGDSKDEESMKREAELRRCFAIFDTDGSGGISSAELKAVLQRPGGGNPMTDEQVEVILQTFATSDDGELHFEDFKAWWLGAGGGKSTAGGVDLLEVSMGVTDGGGGGVTSEGKGPGGESEPPFLDDVLAQCHTTRPPPLSPSSFRAAISSKTFAAGGDAERAAALFEAFFFARFPMQDALLYDSNGWGDTEVVALCEVLTHLANSTHGPVASKSLWLSRNDLTDKGMLAVAACVGAGALPALEQVHVHGNNSASPKSREAIRAAKPGIQVHYGGAGGGRENHAV